MDFKSLDIFARLIQMIVTSQNTVCVCVRSENMICCYLETYYSKIWVFKVVCVALVAFLSGSFFTLTG